MVTLQIKNRGGRRKRRISPGERVSLGLRVTPAIKTLLDRAAEKSGRSQSQEAELRLERTFQDEELFPQIVESAYGRQSAAMILMLARVISEVGSFGGFATRRTIEASQEWMNIPYAYAQVRAAVLQVLERCSPDGDVVLPPPAKPLGDGWPLDEVDNREVLGLGTANAVVDSVLGRGATEDLKAEGAQIRKLLGPAVQQVK
jgi:hypothetical protein